MPQRELHRPLQRLLRRSYGCVRKAEAAAGLSPGHLSRVARGELPLDGARCRRAVELLGSDVEDLRRRQASTPGAEDYLEAVLLPPRHGLRERLRAAERKVLRAIALPAIPNSAPIPRDIAQRLNEPSTPLVSRWLDNDFPRSPAAVMQAAVGLEEVRQRAPQHAAYVARKLAFELCPELRGLEVKGAFAETLGVLASTYRMTGQLDAAVRTLLTALPFSYMAGPRVEARLLYRASYVLRDFCCYDHALQVATTAAELYAKECEPLWVARITADRANLYYRSGQYERAIECADAALAVLPQTDRARSMALTARGQALRALGRRKESRETLRLASTLLNGGSLLEQAGREAIRAELEGEDRNDHVALRHFRKAQSITPDPFDRALISLAISKLLRRQNRHREAELEHQKLKTMLLALKRHPPAQALLADLRKEKSRDALAAARSR